MVDKISHTEEGWSSAGPLNKAGEDGSDRVSGVEFNRLEVTELCKRKWKSVPNFERNQRVEKGIKLFGQGPSSCLYSTLCHDP